MSCSHWKKGWARGTDTLLPSYFQLSHEQAKQTLQAKGGALTRGAGPSDENEITPETSVHKTQQGSEGGSMAEH